ncbi:MAG: polysaccharide biosynthesis tyrosine autokinase [Lentisphaerae bacterium]|nr:polysaccharide biosynthesis tyrosine autokinase [Lentisphaerota bacterium]
MPVSEQPQEEQKLDFRIYIGILFFRWQIIAVCFLYALLAGVLYIHVAPKQHRTFCRLMIYRDPNLEITESISPWRSLSSHRYLLQSERLRERAAKSLIETWGETIGTLRKMTLDVDVEHLRAFGATLDIGVESGNPRYNEDFLRALLAEHREEWNGMQNEASDSAAAMLTEELARLEDRIREAEDDLIEYQRLHDIARVEARGSMESRYLQALMTRRNQLTTELMILEAQYPALQEANPTVINDVGRLTRETGLIEPEPEEPPDNARQPETQPEQPPVSVTAEPEITPAEADQLHGWQELRVTLTRLEQKERELRRNLQPSHPQMQALQKEIAATRNALDLAAETELEKLKDRHEALKIQLEAIEAAEYKWQAKNLLASQRSSELKRIAGVVDRLEENYANLYSRLHDMRVAEELKAEHFRLVEQVQTEEKPVWPDPLKILIVALAVGLGSGFGIALLIQTTDDKIQSIRDVEQVLGIPFLGGVPFWVHSGLERAIRPIVTEEHASGAIEAYRALRTSVVAAMKKMNEKIAVVTSADSREGKTLTALNMAIMIAQMGNRVLLVDMDLRRGRLHRSLGLEKAPGASDALREKLSLRDVIQKSRVENLDLVPTGSSIENSSELLQSTDLFKVFADVQNDYDYIFVDTSPILRVTDTVILATQGPGVTLYVARVNHTPKPLIRYSLEMLKDARVLGLIMNSIELHKISSLYYSYQYPNYAYYSNAYAYGYSHYQYGEGGGPAYGPTLAERFRKLGRKIRAALLPTE